MRRLLFTILVFVLASAGCSAQPPSATLPAVETGIDPDAWARVPAGEFLRGQFEHAAVIDYDYEIMVTDVTNQQVADYLNQALADGSVKITQDGVVGYYPGDSFRGQKHEQEIAAGDWLHMPLQDAELLISYENGSFRARAGYENHPAVMVTWFGAKAYCEYFGWRLPTEIEWEKAARGEDGRAYPWGNTISAQYANYYSSHNLFEKIVGGQGNTSPVGFYNGSSYDGFQTIDAASPYGLYDMAGNVWQWTGDVYPDQHYRYLRGGSKADYGYNLRVWMRNSAGPDYYSVNVGFRCVRDAASISK